MKLFDATLTAWSEWVPEPKANMVIMILPNLRGMKKSALLLIFRAAQSPITVMPPR